MGAILAYSFVFAKPFGGSWCKEARDLFRQGRFCGNQVMVPQASGLLGATICRIYLAAFSPDNGEGVMSWNTMNIGLSRERKMVSMRFFRQCVAVTLVGAIWLPGQALACACGCGIFDVGLPGLPVTGMNDQLSLQYSYMNQNMDHNFTNNVSNALNPDKQIQTDFYTLYGQHMFNQDWGIMAMIPFWHRSFTTDENGIPGVTDASQGVSPDLQSQTVNALSDIRVEGMYTGFSKDKSTGLTFGLKLPTGPYQETVMDRDTAPGTGTTDLLLGGYHEGNINANFSWFTQGTWRHALDSMAGYRPGDSVNATAGFTYNGIADATKIIPMLQFNAQYRAHDEGGGDAVYFNQNSGYKTLYLAPGLLANLDRHWQVNASVYVPLYRASNGYQLVAAELFGAGITYLF